MIIDNQLLDTLSSQAKASPRLRQAYDLRNTENDNSQRLLNALEVGTVMPIHSHLKSSESIVIIRGKMIMRIFDDFGKATDEYTLEPGGKYPMIQVEKGQWHSLEVLESATVVFEAKAGRYEPLRENEIWGSNNILVRNNKIQN